MDTVIAWEDCERCVGLSRRVSRIVMCRQCRHAILPRLAQPGWYKLVGSDHATETEPDPSAPAKKAIRRNMRKFGKYSVRDVGDGLTVAFCRCGQPVEKQGQYCGPCRENARVYGRSSHFEKCNERTAYRGLRAS